MQTLRRYDLTTRPKEDEDEEEKEEQKEKGNKTHAEGVRGVRQAPCGQLRVVNRRVDRTAKLSIAGRGLSRVNIQ